jgi:hypothetical protein
MSGPQILDIENIFSKKRPKLSFLYFLRVVHIGFNSSNAHIVLLYIQ